MFGVRVLAKQRYVHVAEGLYGVGVALQIVGGAALDARATLALRQPLDRPLLGLSEGLLASHACSIPGPRTSYATTRGAVRPAGGLQHRTGGERSSR